MIDWLKLAEQYQDNMIKDLEGLIKIPSLRNLETKSDNAPFGLECRKALDYMFELAKRDSFNYYDAKGYAGRIELGQGEKLLGVLCHLDVVPVEANDWSYPPFELTRVNDNLFGRGTNDDKGPALAAYYALKILKDLNVDLKGRVHLILGCDEESGMECLDYYMKHEEVPYFGFSPDANFPLVYGEKGILNCVIKGSNATKIKKFKAGTRSNIVIDKASATIDNFEGLDKLFDFYLKANHLKGNIKIENNCALLYIEGVASHGAFPQNGINAAVHLLKFIGGATDDALARCFGHLFDDYFGKNLNIAYVGSHMGPLTMNLGIVDIENEQYKFTLDLRVPHDFAFADVTSKIENVLKETEIGAHLEVVKQSNALFVDPNSDMIKTLESVYRYFTNDYKTPLQTIGGGTYARTMPNCVAYGIEMPFNNDETVGGPHQKNEGVSIDTLVKATAIYAKAIYELLK